MVSLTSEKKTHVTKQAGVRGQPPHRPTTARRKLVRKYASKGVSQDRIAAALGISDETLRKYYRVELDAAAGRWEADFEHSLGRDVMATNAAPALKIFLAKVRLGYRELTPKDPDKKSVEEMTNNELRQLVAERARGRRTGTGTPETD